MQTSLAGEIIDRVIVVLAMAALAAWPVAAPGSEAEEADEAEGEAAGAEPPAGSAGERAFWEAILLMSSTDPAKQERGRARLLEAGDLEYPEAQYYLGECWLLGQDGFAKNERKAVSWFRLAADRGHVGAKIQLGTCCLLGTGVRKDRGRARELLEAAVKEAPDFVPPTPPGWFFAERRAMEEPKRDGSGGGPLAARLMASPWEMLVARAHFVLGIAREEHRDLAGAAAMYEAAAAWGEGGRAGVYGAALRAARCRALGRGCTRDLARANALLERSRDLARDNVMAELHSMWTDRKVDDFLLADLEKITGEQADAQLEAEQQSVTASLLADDPAEARRWCRMAAEAGEGWAMLELAELLRLGRGGPADLQGAFEWYSKAAEGAKSWIAVANVLVCHKRGIGTPVNEAAAAELDRKHRHENFACALAGAGFAPQGRWGLTEWWTLVKALAKKNEPLALFLRGRNTFWQITTGRTPSGKLARARREVLGDLDRAVKGGVGQAHYFRWRIYNLRWPEIRGRVDPLEECKKGVAAGDPAAMTDYAIHLADYGGVDGLRRAIELSGKVLAANPGDGNAHNNLGIWLNIMAGKGERIEGIDDIDAASLAHLERAEELGEMIAAKNLAWRYYLGQRAPRDLRLAYTYFLSAAEKGDAEANRMLGIMHENGEGVPVTKREAMYYYRVAALDGDLKALRKVCSWYLDGSAVTRDIEAAKIWLVRLAQTGETRAWISLGDVLNEQRNYAEAFRFWKGMEGSGFAHLEGVACHRLAKIHARGLGVPKDPKKAEKYLERALALGNVSAVCQRARELVKAGKGAEAVELVQSRAGSSAEGLYFLGELRLKGQVVPKDQAAGLNLLIRSSRKGCMDANYLLAEAFKDGVPGAPTREQAIELLEEAEAAGLAKARALREELQRAQGAPEAPPPAETERARSG
jgi:hypothetical protein